MKLNEVSNLRPLRNLAAFVWIKPHWLSNLIIPETVYDLKEIPGQTEGIRTGNFYIGRVLKVGPLIDEIKKDDLIVVHEFGIANYEGTWKENVVYFIEDYSIIAKVLPEPGEKIGAIKIERIQPGKKEIERMIKKIEAENKKEDSKDYESHVRRRGA